MSRDIGRLRNCDLRDSNGDEKSHKHLRFGALSEHFERKKKQETEKEETTLREAGNGHGVI